MITQTDVLILGSGPAGLAAACAARSCGLDVTLVDEQAAPGGQLFRGIEMPQARAMLDAKERATGLRLVEDFRNSGATYIPNAIVWGVEPHKLSYTVNGKSEILGAANIILAPGGMERPVPFPGWTLPGVMGAGGADILLRSGGTLSANPTTEIVLAGNGPLLLLLAGHLLSTGSRISAWLDTGRMSNRLLAAAFMPAGLLDSGYLFKGFGMALKVLRSKVPMIRNASNIHAIGADRLEMIRYTVDGKVREIEANVLLRHEGIIPRTHILQSMHGRFNWDKIHRCWNPVVDEDGATSLEGVFLAGDAAIVHGGDVSILKGTLAGIAVAKRSGVITASEAAFRSAPARKHLRYLHRARSFLRYLFAPNPEIFNIPDETIVCRCECVTAGNIRQAVAQGFTNVNEVKRFTRCGMGQCQGRMCGPALAELVAAARKSSPPKAGMLNVRQPLRPVTLENYCAANLEK